MRVLALEPYFGGSHQAFLNGWCRDSRHEWTLLSLPGYKWKWRMRHASLTMAEQVSAARREGAEWDVIWASDMLNLPEFLGLAPPLGNLPTVLYFHENQLTYPARCDSPRDHHFAFTNFLSAVCATAVWFNSAFHRDEFLNAIHQWLTRMPDYRCLESVENIRAKAEVQAPGISLEASSRPRSTGEPLHILWCARWEHDKNPDDFFAAMEQLRQRGCAFRLSVIGQQFRDVPEVFARAKAQFAAHTEAWGYQPSREAYMSVLRSADVVVSTANHEFFGLSVLEAIAAGAFPLLPRRLAYPEVLGAQDSSIDVEHFYDHFADDLADRLQRLARRHEDGELWRGTRKAVRDRVEQYYWNQRVPELDLALEKAADIPHTNG